LKETMMVFFGVSDLLCYVSKIMRVEICSVQSILKNFKRLFMKIR
jgi:hypothetical protein